MASELAAALAKVQADIPHVAKGATADTGSYSYDYADLTAVTAAILPLLGKHGLAFTARPTVIDGRFVLAYSLLHASGDREDGEYPLPEKGTPQQLGGHITYARRYALCAVTGVAPGGEDNDAAGAAEVQMDRQPAEPAEPTAVPDDRDEPGTVSKPQLTKLGVLFTALGFAKTDRTERLGASSELIGRHINTASELSRNEAAHLIHTLEGCDGDQGKLIELLAEVAANAGSDA